ncbi:hypothetical protein CYLTODRAFT_327614, partial [Cylindrobasidium torrendii FP15055 ss-10]
ILLAIYVGAAGIHVAPVIIVTICTDLFQQMQQVALSTAIFSIAPEARARLNNVFILAVGHPCIIMGTSAGTRVFTQYEWRPAAALSLGWCGWQLFILLRGPACQRYTLLGWEG